MSFRFVPRSLKYRLLLAFLVGMVLIEVGASYLSYRLMERHIWDEFDRMLEDKVRFYKSTCFFDDRGRPQTRMGDADWDRVSDPKDPDYFQMNFANGHYFRRSLNLRGVELAFQGTLGEEITYTGVILPNGKKARVAGALLSVKHYLGVDKDGKTDFWGPSKDQPMQIIVARSTDAVAKTLSEVRWRLLAAAVAGTVALLLAAYVIIRRNFRTAGVLTRQIDEMELVDTQQRFNIPGAPEELEKVIVRLNALMNRVTSAIENERQFTSNAAHELRTPLAGMRSAIDLALTRTRSVAEYEDTLYQLKSMQWKLQQLTENLLLLARLDSGQCDFGQAEGTLRQFLRSAWKPFFDPACEKELSVAWKIEDPGTPLLLPTKLLDIVLRNLFQNAIDYSPVGGRLEISCAVNSSCVIQVTNPNPGLQAEQLEQLFQRFWRADLSGDPNTSSVGIGLSLCKRIMGVLGGTITAQLTPDDQIAISCSFPAVTTGVTPTPTLEQPDPRTARSSSASNEVSETTVANR